MILAVFLCGAGVVDCYPALYVIICPMAMSSSQLRVPKYIVHNKKLYRFLLITIVVISSLGALYYFHIKSNEVHFRENKLLALDSYYERFSKKLNNDILRELATATSTRDSLSAKRFADIVTKSSGGFPLNQDFDEFVMDFKNDHTAIAPKSSLYITKKIDLDTIFSKDALNIGVVMPYEVLDKKYQLFAKRYQFIAGKENPLVNKNLEIRLVGLVSEAAYSDATRKLDPWIIAMLAIFLLLFMIGLPFFKMIFIAEDEQLTGKDVIMAGFTVIIGAPVIVAAFLSLINYLDALYIETPGRLEAIAKNIETNFEAENQEHVEALALFDLKPYNISYADKKGLACPSRTPFMELRKADDRFRESFKFLSLIDSVGVVAYHINFIKRPNCGDSPKSLRQRNYFQDIKSNKNIWSSPAGLNYVMRPVVSIEDMTEEAVYILPATNGGGSYKVGSSQLKSVHEAILPFGFQFAIIDADGEVWFHSQTGRATLENFLKVSRSTNILEAALSTRIRAAGFLSYHDENNLFCSLPIKGTNLSVVTFYDTSLLRLQISEVLSITSIAILLAFLLTAFVMLLTIFIKPNKWRLYKEHTFLFDFLTPKKAFKARYIILTGSFSFLLLVSMIIANYVDFDPSSAFIASLLFIIWTYFMVYYTVHTDHCEGVKTFSHRDALLILTVVSLNLLLWIEGSGNWHIFRFALVPQVLCLIYFLISLNSIIRKSLKEWIGLWCDKFNISYQYWYAFFLFSWLLLASVLPTLVFFEKAKRINEQVWTKTDQLFMAKNYAEKEEKLRKILPLISGRESEFDSLYTNQMAAGQYGLEGYMIYRDNWSRGSGDHSGFRDLLLRTRPIYDEKVRPYQGLIYQRAWDDSWQTFERYGDVRFELKSSADEGNAVISEKSALALNERGAAQNLDLKVYLTLITVLVFIVILGILLSLTLFYINRFFGIKFRYLRPNDYDNGKYRAVLKNFVDLLYASEANSGLLIIGPPVTGKSRFTKRIVAKAGVKTCAVASFLRIDDLSLEDAVETIFNKLVVGSTGNCYLEKQWEDNEIFILENLEHDSGSLRSNHIKLRLISHLIAQNKRLIITSEIYPSQILAAYTDNKDQPISAEGKNYDDFISWRNILSAFPQILLGITQDMGKVNKRLEDKAFDQIDPKIKISLAAELGYSLFLPTLARIVLEKCLYPIENYHTATKNSKIGYPEDRCDENVRDQSGALKKDLRLDRQRMILHIQNLAYGYYTDIWNSLPTRERYMLYDLARDGFLNMKNTNSLFSLMKKGLIVWRDRPKMFNSSFTNYVISSVSTSEALKLELKNRGGGSWGTMRVVFYLVILAIIIFILLGKPGLFKDFETMIGALGGIGVVVPIISSILAKSGEK